MGDTTAERCHRHAAIGGICAEGCVIPNTVVQTCWKQERIQCRTEEDVLACAHRELSLAKEESGWQPVQFVLGDGQAFEGLK